MYLKFLVELMRAEDQAPYKISEDSKLSLLVINIRSLRDKRDELFLLLEELNYPEIFAITELWLSIYEPVLVKNYTTISWFNRRFNEQMFDLTLQIISNNVFIIYKNNGKYLLYIW